MSKASELNKIREIKTRTDCDDMNFANAPSLSEYYDDILDKKIEQSVVEYRQNLDNIHEEFKLKTNLTDIDIAFLGVATALQCARIYLVNKFTEIEKAGEGAREDYLHNKQEEIL